MSLKRKTLIIYTFIMAVLSIISVALVVLNFIGKIQLFSYPYFLIDAFITFLFFVDYILRLTKAKYKRVFVQRNIFDLIAMLPIILILKVFNLRNFILLAAILRFSNIAKIIRLFRVLNFASNLRKRTVRFLYTNGFIYVLYVTFSFIILSSALISYLEGWTFDQSVWFSFATCATVGYGDLVPLTREGKIISIILMIFGVALLGMLTGTITTYFSNKAKSKRVIHKNNIAELLDVCASFSQQEVDLLIDIAKNISSGTIEISMRNSKENK